MNRIWKELGIAILMGAVLPGLILHLAVESARVPKDTAAATEPTEINRVSMTVPILTEDGGVSMMELDEYLTGVVLAEMPASFEAEALKAQSVVARTYTLRAYGGTGKHGEAAVCTDSTCCQGYRSPEEYLAAGGTQESLDKISRAVVETSGYVLTYGGELIEATYFSCSGGRTEDAVAVWGTDVPYLRSVNSPGEENAAHYTDELHFTKEELEQKLDVSLQDDQKLWTGDMSYTAGGGVAQIRIGDRFLTGTELRRLLGLRSTAFTVTASDTGLTFETRGYGHRVGMSQYGADAMAVDGSTFREILTHYYPGTQLEKRVD